ncbi:MAG: hypothetical protein QXV69_00535 [Sulfolobaceae archaeon]
MKKVNILVIEDYLRSISDEEIKSILEKIKADKIIISKLHIPSWSEEDSEQITGVYVLEEELIST